MFGKLESLSLSLCPISLSGFKITGGVIGLKPYSGICTNGKGSTKVETPVQCQVRLAIVYYHEILISFMAQ